MTAKEYVKSVHPKARAERHATYGKSTYWLILPHIKSMYIGSGKTAIAAWKDAKKTLEKNKQP